MCAGRGRARGDRARALRGDETSILSLYRRLLTVRRASPALQTGSWTSVDAPGRVLAYERETDTDRRRVLANFGDEPVEMPRDDGWAVDVSTDPTRARSPWDGRLRGSEAVILRPR